MTETLNQARDQVAKAVEARIVELMAEVVQKAKSEIAAAVLDEVGNPFDETELNDAIANVLIGWDHESEINLASSVVAGVLA